MGVSYLALDAVTKQTQPDKRSDDDSKTIQLQQSSLPDTYLTRSSGEKWETGEKKHLKNSKCSFYLQRKSPTDVYAFIKLTDLLGSPVLLAELPLCFCSESWEIQTRRGFWGDYYEV